MASALKKRNNRSLFHIRICVKMNSRFILPVLWCCLLYHGVCGVAADEVAVKEGKSVTLHTGVETNQQVSIKWYFSETRIAEITGDLSKICTDVQCNEGTERFRDRLKLDHQTGSLTITNTRTTDSGLYHQVSNGKNSYGEKTFNVTVHGFFRDGTDGVSVFLMERDSVTFQTGVETNQQQRIRWYFGDTRIAQITGDLSKSCTDVQCNEGTERFRDRLKMDHQTGSLTIMNITNTDSGVYQVRISSKNNGEVDTTFYFAVHDVSALILDEMKEGGNVILYTDVIKNPKDLMTWYFNDILIAGDQSKICTDVQCKERFRDRLKLNNQTGSLTITNIRTTDSGLYQLQMNSSRVSIVRNFTVTFNVVSPPSTNGAGTNAAVIVGAVSGVLLIAAVAVVVYCCQKRSTKTKQKDTTEKDIHDEENDEAERFLHGQNCIQMNHVNGTTTDQAVANGTTTDQDVTNGTS
uniref:Carcinoembryonic antigen-related cell adhesion molecule 1-like n=1 Tax=Cyprinus carpio TaxID=7962 RepID=A0A8C2AJE8_CYPCA